MEKIRNIYEKLHSIKWAGIKLQRDTKAFNYKYATLSQIQEKFWEALQEQNLVVIHSIIEWCVKTEIVDVETKESISSQIEMSVWVKPQDKWSEITYYRRYNLLSLLDLEVEDDDWKKAQDSKVETKEYASKENEPTEWMSDDNLKAFIPFLNKFSSEKEAVAGARKKYKVSREMAGKIEDSWSDLGLSSEA